MPASTRFWANNEEDSKHDTSAITMRANMRMQVRLRTPCGRWDLSSVSLSWHVRFVLPICLLLRQDPSQRCIFTHAKQSPVRIDSLVRKNGFQFCQWLKPVFEGCTRSPQF